MTCQEEREGDVVHTCRVRRFGLGPTWGFTVSVGFLKAVIHNDSVQPPTPTGSSLSQAFFFFLKKSFSVSTCPLFILSEQVAFKIHGITFTIIIQQWLKQ